MINTSLQQNSACFINTVQNVSHFGPYSQRCSTWVMNGCSVMLNVFLQSKVAVRNVFNLNVLILFTLSNVRLYIVYRAQICPCHPAGLASNTRGPSYSSFCAAAASFVQKTCSALLPHHFPHNILPQTCHQALLIHVPTHPIMKITAANIDTNIHHLIMKYIRIRNIFDCRCGDSK